MNAPRSLQSMLLQKLARFRFATMLCTLVACALLSAGCSNKPEVAPTSGRVSYKGKPVPYGKVFFQPEQGTHGRGKIQPDGTFVITTYKPGDGARVGRHRVRITSYEIQDPNGAKKIAAGSFGKANIPEKYDSLETTGLKEIEVKGGDNTFDFDLKD